MKNSQEPQLPSLRESAFHAAKGAAALGAIIATAQLAAPARTYEDAPLAHSDTEQTPMPAQAAQTRASKGSAPRSHITLSDGRRVHVTPIETSAVRAPKPDASEHDQASIVSTTSTNLENTPYDGSETQPNIQDAPSQENASGSEDSESDGAINDSSTNEYPNDTLQPGNSEDPAPATGDTAPGSTESGENIFKYYDAFAQHLTVEDDTQSNSNTYVFGTLLLPPLKGGPNDYVTLKDPLYEQTADKTGYVFATALGSKADTDGDPKKLDATHLQFFFVKNESLQSIVAYPEANMDHMDTMAAKGTLKYEADMNGQTNGDILTMQGQRVGVQEFQTPDFKGQASYYPHVGEMDGQLVFSELVASGK